MSADKKDTTESIEAANTTRSNVVLRCGDCLHYTNSIHPGIGELCKARGVRSFAAAPTCYTANVTVFRRVSPDTFRHLALLISAFTPQQSRVLMGLLKSAGTLEKAGLTFLQKVYFNLGEDYLDNYYSGYALGIGLEGSIMVASASTFSTVKSPLIAHLLRDRVLNEERFKKKRAKLLAEGRLYTPRHERKNVISTTDPYEPPTLETAQELLESMAAGKNKKKAAKMGVLEIDLNHVRETAE